MQKKQSLTTTAGNLARSILRGKVFVLRHAFYWISKAYVESIGREITWTVERISVEEIARARNQSLTRCKHCNSLVKTTQSEEAQ